MKNIFCLSIALIYNFISIQVHSQHLDIRVPDTLNFVDINGNPQAYYELLLANFHSDTIRLKKLEISNFPDSSVLFYSERHNLLSNFDRIGTSVQDSTLLIPPGSLAIIYIELPLKHQSTTEILHHVTYDVPGSTVQKIETTPTLCALKDPLVLGKPLDAGNWVAIYEPSWARGHRRVIYPRNGRARIPGRYAIDFIQVDAEGNYVEGDKNILGNWLGYGADVLADADGEVVALREEFPESTTVSDHTSYSSYEASGYYISTKIAEGYYAFYEVWKPNSINVKTGQKVKKGDVLASLGLTGQGTSPHLHFHVADTDSALGAEGIPFVFEEFELLGSYPNFKDFGKQPWQPRDNSMPPTRQKERPMPNAVLRFK